MEWLKWLEGGRWCGLLEALVGWLLAGWSGLLQGLGSLLGLLWLLWLLGEWEGELWLVVIGGWVGSFWCAGEWGLLSWLLRRLAGLSWWAG